MKIEILTLFTILNYYNTFKTNLTANLPDAKVDIFVGKRSVRNLKYKI